MPEPTSAHLELTDERAKSFEGISLRRFKKELIRTGSWIHPQHKYRVDVTPKRMRDWVSRFDAMRKAGIRIPLPPDHSSDSRRNMGFVEKMWVTGDRLYAEMDFPNGSDSEMIGKTIREVSINVSPNYVDGKGVRWGEVINHVSPCTRPVVGGQENFIEVGVNLSGEQVKVLSLQRERKSMPATLQETIIGKLKLDADSDDAAILKAVEDSLAKDKEHTKVLRRAKEERDKALSRTIELEVELTKAKKASDKEPDPEPEPDPQVIALQQQVIALRTKSAEAEINGLQKSGRLAKSDDAINACRALLMAEDTLISGVANVESDGFSLAQKPDKQVARLFGVFLKHLPEGAVLMTSDLSSQAIAMSGRLNSGEVTQERADELAKEQVKLAGQKPQKDE